MTPEQLKSSILQYAFQGKLVEQICTEENSDLLFDKIIENRRNLVKKGLANKAKNLPDISENEIPYDIPESWVWVRLNDIVFNHGQKTPDNTFSYIDIGSIDNIHQKLNKEESLIEADKAPSRARKIVKIGDIIYSTVRPYLHNTCIIDKKFEREPIASTGFAVLACCEGIYNKFLFYYLLAPVFDSYANATDNAKGVAYPAINDDKLYRAIVPLPPLEEQHRIVAKIEELLPFVDRYAEAYEKLEKFNAKFPEDMKKSILQYAIMGKLVEQRPEDGTAEKNSVIDNPDVPRRTTEQYVQIEDDELPFELPQGWIWKRMGEVLQFVGGSQPPKNMFSDDLKEGYVRLIQIRDYKSDAYKVYIPKNSTKKFCTAQDIMIGRYGPPIFQILRGIDGAYNVALMKAVPLIEFNNDFLYYFLQNPSLLNSLVQKSSRSCGQDGIDMETLKNYVVAIPPVEEQKRIAAKIEELLPYCDALIK